MNKLEINWVRAVGEFAVIVVGVLVALGVDNWNQDREDLALEREYLQRLERDIRADSTMQEFLLSSLAEKADALDLVSHLIHGTGPGPDDLRQFLRALASSGMAFSWGFPVLKSLTFEDLTGTGNLGLLRDSETRDSIISYYKNANHRLNRIGNRHTQYPHLVYSIVPPEVIAAFPQTDPRAPEGLARQEAAPQGELNLSGREVSDLMSLLRGSDFRRALNAELNFAQFAKLQVDDNLSHAADLLNFLRAEY
jgi:hypothetical protein